MSESESFGSAKDDENFEASDVSDKESEDLPLAKNKTTPKKLKSSTKATKEKKKEKSKRGRKPKPKQAKVSFARDPLEGTEEKAEEEYEVNWMSKRSRLKENPTIKGSFS